MELKKSPKYYGYRISLISIAVNIVLFALKYTAGVMTGSVALIADAWHTLSDILSSVVVIFGFKIASKEPDKEHPFGHGRAESIAAALIGVLLAIVAYSFFMDAIDVLVTKKSVEYTGFAIFAVAASIVLNEGLTQLSIRVGKKIKSKSLIADGWHHRSDSLSSVVVLLGMLFGDSFWWIDGVLGIIVSLLILYTAYQILRDTFSKLLGKAADEELLNSIIEASKEISEYDLQVHHVHAHDYGNHLEVTLHVFLPESLNLKEAHSIISKFEYKLKNELKIEPTIHIDPLEH